MPKIIRSLESPLVPLRGDYLLYVIKTYLFDIKAFILYSVFTKNQKLYLSEMFRSKISPTDYELLSLNKNVGDFVVSR